MICKKTNLTTQKTEACGSYKQYCLKDDRNLDRTYKEFFRRYANDPEQNRRLLESLLGQARLLKKKKRVRQAKAKYEEVINEFNARGLEPGSQDAQYPAEAAFELVEYDFVAYEKLQIKGRLEKQGEIIQKLKKELENFLALKKQNYLVF